MKQFLVMFGAFLLMFVGLSFYQNRDLDIFEDTEFIDGGDILNEEVRDEHESIVVHNVVDEQVISSPLELQGEIRGNWVFEASAPVLLTNWDGLIIGESFISTEEDWMTADFVSFAGKIEFEMPDDIGEFSNKGYLIFQKNNPSDLRELDDAYEIEIRFR